MTNPYIGWTSADHAAARQKILVSAPRSVRLRCDQNTIFGCGKVTTVTAEYRPIGPSAVTQSAFVWCACGLPLASHRTLYPTR